MTENKKFEGIIIVSDFDGTLRADTNIIPQRNIDAIEFFKANGGIFTVASGRAEFVLDVIEPKVKELVNGPCIFSNGSYLYDYSTGEKFKEKCIPEDNIREILYLIKDIAPEVAIRIVRFGQYITPDDNDEIKLQIKRGFMENVVAYTYETVPVDNINKITICGSHENVVKIRLAIEKAYSENVNMTFSWKSVLEIQEKNVSKASLLNEIRNKYTINGKKPIIYAVGDYENDIEMLKSADFSCCPSNAQENVKQVCKIHLCSNNEGALADLIEKIENNLV